MAEVTSSKIAEQIIKRANKMPPAPPVAFKLLSVLRDPKHTCDEVVEVIRYDPDLTAQLLRICNSVSVSGSVQIASVDEAVMRLGDQIIVEKVLALGFGSVYAKTKGGYGLNPYKLWRHCIASALAAKHLTHQCVGYNFDVNLAFTAALLHDIGKAVLNNIDLPGTEKVRTLMIHEGLSCSEAEQKALGTDHSEVGSLLLERWNLPKEIVTAVRYHVHPELEPTGFASLIYTCSLCALAIATASSWDDFKECIDASIPQYLGISDAAITEALDKIKKDATAIEAFMMVA